jgi:hypothetical protein
VTSIGSSAFEGCNGFIGNLLIPNNVTSIANYAFIGCGGFNGTLTIGEKVSSIGTYSFTGAPFSSIVVNSSNTSYKLITSDNASMVVAANHAATID